MSLPDAPDTETLPAGAHVQRISPTTRPNTPPTTVPVYDEFGRPREPIGRESNKRLAALLRDALLAEEIEQFGRAGAQFSEDQAIALALSG